MLALEQLVVGLKYERERARKSMYVCVCACAHVRVLSMIYIFETSSMRLGLLENVKDDYPNL